MKKIFIISIALLMMACTETEDVRPEIGELNGKEYVDLGLSVNWATTNLESGQYDICGGYYPWGSTVTQPIYDMAHCPALDLKRTNISGDPQYDAATKSLGGDWRLPTVIEFNELVQCCRWQWTRQNDVNGYKVTGPNGNSIFLPCGGHVSFTTLYYFDERGCYWTGSSDQSIEQTAYMMILTEDNINERSMSRVLGVNIRPVFDK